MTEIIRRFGITFLFGILIGAGLATWVSPTTGAGTGVIVVLGTFTTIVVIEVFRALFRRPEQQEK